jgi:hypothetical protein
VTDEPYYSRYRKMMKTLRAILTNEENCLYLLHTPAGVINISRCEYQLEGFVIVTGDDENSKPRFVVFSEEQMCSYPLEVRRKGQEALKEIPGFKLPPSGAEDRV